jgi:hypothetical protein
VSGAPVQGVPTDLNGLSLDQLVEVFTQAACAQAKIDPDRWGTTWARRHGWGCKKESLARIGDSLGFTRERIRQIQVRLDTAASERRELTVPDRVATMLMAMPWDAGDDIGPSLVEAGLTTTERNWSASGVVDFLRLFGQDEVATFIEEKKQAADQALDPDLRPEPGLLSAVREARSGLGVLDLRAVVYEGRVLAPEEVSQILPWVYRYSWTSGHWVLCRNTSKLTSLENVALQQLAIAGALDQCELIQGIDRVARKRRWQMAPEAEIIALLVQSNTISVERDACRSLGSAEVDPPVGNDAWLVAQLSDAPGHVLTADELMERAARDRVKRAALVVHLTYSPLVRRERGLIRLVGANPTSSIRDALRRAAGANKVKSSYSIRAHPDGLELSLRPGTNGFNSGVISIRKDLRAVVEGHEFQMKCCSAVEFNGRLRFKSPSAWINWAPMFNHWVEHHGIDDEDSVRLLITDDTVWCLEPWSDLDTGSLDSHPTPTVALPEAKSHDGEVATATNESPSGTSSQRKTAEMPEMRPEKGLGHSPPSDVKPGDSWSQPKGRRVVVLSLKAKDLLTRDKKTRLSESLGPQASQVAREWLKIRPSGGRVWIDDEGNAVTAVEDRLIYLGMVPKDWRW